MGKIADISKWQGKIDWKTASKELDMCILRASCGRSTDSMISYNATECKKYNVPFGVYHYLMCGTAEDAIKEAEFFYGVANQYQPLFYVADVEYDAQTETTTNTVVENFFNTLRKLGAEKIGLYANRKRKYISQNVVDMFDFTWVPRYGLNLGEADDVNYPPKYPCDLWQYCSTGSVNGISGRVDLNKLYGDKTLNWFLNIEEKEQKKNVCDVELNILRKGSYGSAVTALQILLLGYGYELPKYGADSDFGEETKRAVIKYQNDERIDADGIVGKDTWTHLLH